MSFKINNNAYKGFFKRSYTSAFKQKRNPDMYTKKRSDSYNFNSTYNTLLNTSYSSGFMRDITNYANSLENETETENKPSPTADQNKNPFGVQGGYRSRTVYNNSFHAQKINELMEQQQQGSEETQETDLNSLLFDMKSRMGFFF